MRYFPMFLDLRDRPVLIAGGGEQAAMLKHAKSASAELGTRIRSYEGADRAYEARQGRADSQGQKNKKFGQKK